MMKSLNLKYIDISEKTGVPERTITSFVWENKPLGAQLLRELHTKFSVSLDWLLSGYGSMLCHTDTAKENEKGDAVTPQNDDRTTRIHEFVDDFMASASEDEKSWLEVQLKLHIPQYAKFLERKHDT